MPKNTNIVTKSKFLGGKSSHVAIGSSVAAGMTRYVTMLKVNQEQKTAGKGSRVIFCSTAASNTAANTAAASTAQKMKVVLPSSLYTDVTGVGVNVHTVLKTKQIPNMPDTENPLFTISESKFFSAYLASVAGASSPVNIFAQYYDQ